MGANVADFSVIRDRAFALDVNGLDSERINFDFRANFLADLDGIVTFMIRTSNDLRLRIDINNTPIAEEDIVDGNFERLYQEVFPMSSISFGGIFGLGRQEATFTALRGSGSFSDVVVWYRRDSE
jgi:hypothetical protein